MSREVRVACWLLALGSLVGCGGGGGDDSANNEPSPDLAGSIAIEAQTRVDSDTADEIRLGLAIDNGSPAAAQNLPTNATLGGYLSASGSSYTNGFGYFPDNTDYYAVDLVAGDRITFQVFSSPAGLLSTHTDPPARQVRILEVVGGSLEEVIPPVSASGDFDPITIALDGGFTSGSYLLELSASAGMPFRYVLSLADVANTASLNAEYAEPPFVTNQAIVQMFPGAQSVSMASAMSASASRHLGDDVWLMQRNGSRVARMSSDAQASEKRETLDWVRELGQRSDVVLAEPNYLYFSQAVNPDDDDFYFRQWNLSFMQTPLAWQVAPALGTGVGIAVMDTGLFTSSPGSASSWHPDLDLNVSLLVGQTMDFVSGSLDIDGTGGRDTNPADPGDGKIASSSFHGTHVAGIAAAVDNSEGIVGVAPLATVYPFRVLGRDGVGSSADLIAAINFVAGRSEIDVINLSLGGLGPSTALSNAINAAWDGGNGQLIVAAAGNQNSSQATYPAAYSNVVGVAAVDGAGERAGYSNVGPSVDVAAPGGDASRDANQDSFADVIVSTWGTDDGGVFVPGYAGLQGTSMAAPHVAGIYALMKGEVPLLTPGQFMAYLRAGELTQPKEPARDYGAGLIDALLSMYAAFDGTPPVSLSASPSAIQLNSAVLSGQVELTSFPEGELFDVTGATSSESWLSATVGNTTAVTSTTVTVSADISGLEPDQRYVAEITISYSPESSAPDELVIPVSLQLGSAADDKDAGRHYVLLVSADGARETVYQQVVTSVNGRYRFSFAPNSIEPGEYFLVAGTDTDNNALICENGEACAEYPVNGLPEAISLGEAARTGIKLSTSFRRPTVSSLGLPRTGFEGYRLLPDAGNSGGPLKEVSQ